MYGLILFDLDGTLADSRDDIATSVNLTLDSFGFPRRASEDVYGFIGGGVHNLIRKSLPEDKGHLLDEGVEVFWGIYKEHVLDTTRLFPGIRGMLDSLSISKMAVVTNKPLTHTELILDGLGVRDLFHSVQGWSLGTPLKPDPAMLLEAIKEAGAAKDSVVMVGDSSADILAARATGVKSCAVGYGYGRKDKLLEYSPDVFAEDVEALTYVLTR